MLDRLTDCAENAMTFAREEAFRTGQDVIGTEHILLGVIREEDGNGGRILRHMGIDLEQVVQEVERIVPVVLRKPALWSQLPFTPRGRTVLELASDEANHMGQPHIGSGHLLLGLIKEGEGIAAQVLTHFNVRLVEVRQKVAESLMEPNGNARTEGYRVTTRTVWTHWYESGQKQSEGCYRDDQQRQGHWTFWNEDGSIDEARTGFYEDGELATGQP
jgi:ATP-dependent Clp protease ATP-binding subunit ClpC